MGSRWPNWLSCFNQRVELLAGSTLCILVEDRDPVFILTRVKRLPNRQGHAFRPAIIPKAGDGERLPVPLLHAHGIAHRRDLAFVAIARVIGEVAISGGLIRI